MCDATLEGKNQEVSIKFQFHVKTKKQEKKIKDQTTENNTSKKCHHGDQCCGQIVIKNNF